MAMPRELEPSIISNSDQNVCFWHNGGVDQKMQFDRDQVFLTATDTAFWAII
jgi:predicted glutamine amidotransferase